MCGIYLRVSARADDAVDTDSALGQALARRGPDAAGSTMLETDGRWLCFLSTVLHLRGSETVAQPLASERFVLQWNGEVYSGLDVRGRNDTTVLFEALHQQSGPEGICSVMSLVRGEYALVLYDRCESLLYYGRDYFGRRSLVLAATADTLEICSVVPADRQDFGEVPAAGLWRIDLRRPVLVPELIAWAECGPLFAPVPRITKEMSPIGLDMDRLVETSIAVFRRSLERRLLCIPFDLQETAQVAILFSGGIDSVIMAAIADLVLGDEVPIDLLNVAFENPRFIASRGSQEDPFAVPDRLTGLRAWEELRTINSRRRWNFVEVDVTREEYEERREHVVALMRPSKTAMDLSIAIALWFAARGQGHLVSPLRVPYRSHAKVLLVGMGADEQLCGYSRHRSAFQSGGREALLREMQMELDRIAHRNLGRDDRCITDHGKEARFPFLDEELVSFLCSLPVEAKADMTRPKGQSEKRLLRLMAQTLGFSPQVAHLPKRAIQFGAKTAKMTSSGEAGADAID